MSESWEIRVPHRSRTDSIASVADCASETMEGEERAVAQRLVFDALARGVTEVGELLDELEAAGPAGRRQLLDQARVNAGLRPTEREEQHREFERANAVIPSRSRPRDSRGRTAAVCSAPGCRAMAADPEHPGVIALTTARRWTCEKHRDQGDFSDWTPEPAFRYSRSGALIHVAEAEAEGERQRAAAESRRARYEARAAERREDAERLAAFEEAAAEQFRRESITGGAS